MEIECNLTSMERERYEDMREKDNIWLSKHARKWILFILIRFGFLQYFEQIVCL